MIEKIKKYFNKKTIKENDLRRIVIDLQKQINELKSNENKFNSNINDINKNLTSITQAVIKNKRGIRQLNISLQTGKTLKQIRENLSYGNKVKTKELRTNIISKK